MADFSPPRGLIAAPVTPLNEDGTLDGEGLARLLGRIKKSCHAVFLATPVPGEGHLLGADILCRMLELSLAVLNGHIPIFMWISRKSADETSFALQRLREVLERHSYTGPFFWVDCPILYRSNRGLFDHYSILTETAGNPILLFNDADFVHSETSPFKRKNIRTSILGELASLPGIAGLFYKGSLDRLYNYSKVVNRIRNFPIYEGDEDRFLETPGLRGVVSAGANLMPETWSRVTSFCLEISGEKTIYPEHLMQIWKMGRNLRELLDAYRTHPAAVLKADLYERGVIKSAKCLSAPKKDISLSVQQAVSITSQDDQFL